VSLFILVKSAHYAVIYSSRVAKIFHISEFIIGFFLVAFIAILPEATIAIISAINGIPEFGLSTLFGSKVADLSLVFGIIAIFSIGGIKIKSEVLKKNFFYLILLLIPIILGFDGHLSRLDGMILVLSGLIFFLTLYIQNGRVKMNFRSVWNKEVAKSLFFVFLSLAVLITSSHYIVKFGVNLSNDLMIPAFFIAITFIAISTCLPELIFSLNAVRTKRYELALGDILGSVVIDVTIIIGIIALLNPFSFNSSIVYVTGTMMFLAGLLVVRFISTGKVLSKKEGIYLVMFYILSLMIEFMVNYIFY
jgi:cation:H+ antiporter